MATEIKSIPCRDKTRELLSKKFPEKAVVLEKYVYNSSVASAKNKNILMLNDPQFWMIYITNSFEIVDSEMSPQEIVQKCTQAEFGFNSRVFKEDTQLVRLEEDFMLNPNSGQDVVPGTEKCPKCKGNRVHMKEIQTRSADEGATIFFKCADPKCGKTWKQYN